MYIPVAGLLLLITSISCHRRSQCRSLIFCQGDLLHTVQMSRIFKDSKTFVDMSVTGSVDSTLRDFDHLMLKCQGAPTKEQILSFVNTHFQAADNELEYWYPTDYHVNPPFLHMVKDPKVKNFAKHIVHLWPNLGRKIKSEVQQNPQKHSIIPIPNGFIVPGGRFREFYYWDSYWIVRGLLISDMKHTVRGMLDNFFFIVEHFGFIPNGGRIYYLDRSQPPMLTMMVMEFMEETNDVRWLQRNIHLMERELEYWLTKKIIKIEKGGKTYRMARYISSDDTPRPESYIEDIHTALNCRTEEEKRRLYLNIRSGAETGWDFSGRWFFDKQGGNRGDLSTINPTRIVPVDLNAFLCRSFQIMAHFHGRFRNRDRAKFWTQKSKEWMTAIRDVLYHERDGIWYDYDIDLKALRSHFYPSNFAPLWVQAFDSSDAPAYGKNASRYLKAEQILKYAGGIPTSLYETGEQWDLPNAWAPTQAMVIFGLDKSQDPESKAIAEELASKWIESLIVVSDKTNELFEKYNAVFKGMYGGGGEYEVQTGFGWTNGFALELIEHYWIKKKDPVAQGP